MIFLEKEPDLLFVVLHCFVQQENRKKCKILPNGLVEGDEEAEEGGHGGPELQRTGRYKV